MGKVKIRRRRASVRAVFYSAWAWSGGGAGAGIIKIRRPRFYCSCMLEGKTEGVCMKFSDYQAGAAKTAVYPGRGENNWIYPALGLAGESGEICEKIKKCLRDDGGRMTEERRSLLSKELGDVLWYVATMCSELGLDLDAVASGNLAKLAGRQAAGKLHGSGDLR